MYKIPYGISNFEKIRDEGFIYVDKTHYLYKLESLAHIIHLRPRRFGKSLFLSMLEAYYDVAGIEKYERLFKGLYVYENPTPYQGQYYVLRFNFSGIGNMREGDISSGFTQNVEFGIERFVFKYQLPITIKEGLSAAAQIKSFFVQFEKLKLKHKVYVLIDEYDHFTNTLLTGDGQAFLKLLTKGGFVRAFYEVLKESSEKGILDRLFITGVMSVTLDSMTSGFNIATNITTRSTYAELMGFTAEEVKQLLNLTYRHSSDLGKTVEISKTCQSKMYDIFKTHYNGYLFSADSDIRVFNSTLIMYFMSHYIDTLRAPDTLVDDNLNQTGQTIENIVSLKNQETNLSIIELIIQNNQVGGTLQPFIKIDTKFDENDLITLLFNIGMLTIKKREMETIFEMPNHIIKTIYFEYLKNVYEKNSSYVLSLSQQKRAITQLGNIGDVGPLTELVSEFLSKTSARSKIKFDEKYIKLVYLMLLSYTNQLHIYDEFPALQGYSDVFIQKGPNSYATYEVLIELKYIKISETTDALIEARVKEGTQQIREYMQDSRIAKRENLKCYVIVFSGFEVVRIDEIL